MADDACHYHLLHPTGPLLSTITAHFFCPGLSYPCISSWGTAKEVQRLVICLLATKTWRPLWRASVTKHPHQTPAVVCRPIVPIPLPKRFSYPAHLADTHLLSMQNVPAKRSKTSATSSCWDLKKTKNLVKHLINGVAVFLALSYFFLIIMADEGKWWWRVCQHGGTGRDHWHLGSCHLCGPKN